MSFDSAFEIVIGNEGGYSAHPQDPGGETKYGIAQRSHPHINIQELTIEQAKSIYLSEYWGPICGDSLPPSVAVHVFDAAVNHGVLQSIKLMQRALLVDDDGIIGPATLRAARLVDADKFCRRFCAARLTFYTSLKTWPVFGRGWTNRVALMLEAV